MDSILGWIATILFTIELIPQIWKTVITKDVKGVSSWVTTFYLVGNVVALFYAISIHQLPLIVKYSIALPVAIISLSVFFRYSRRFGKMILISNNVRSKLSFPADAVVRVNAAWIQSKAELHQVLTDNKDKEVYLDYPEGRTKPPKPVIAFQDVVDAANRFENVRFFAVSNAEQASDMEDIRSQVPLRAKIVPKIETQMGVLNVLAIAKGAQTDVVMLDKEDLYSAVNRNVDQFNMYVNTLRTVCSINQIEVLELQGVIFYGN
jgi:uncharacterized protein with PQ loop repeat